MRRLGLFLLCLVLMCGFASAENYEASEDSLLFWSKLTYQDKAVDITVPPPACDYTINGTYADQYLIYFVQQDDASYNLKWAGMTFDITQYAPNYDGGVNWNHPYKAWPRYFNEMYYLGGKAIETDENGYTPFWDMVTFNGESIDPYTAPPNYDPDLDYWREMRDSIGYAWYWYYWAYEVFEVEHFSNPAWNWNGIDFEPYNHNPPTYPEDHIEAAEIDPWFTTHGTRGYLDLWEEYFNDLYYQSLSE